MMFLLATAESLDVYLQSISMFRVQHKSRKLACLRVWISLWSRKGLSVDSGQGRQIRQSNQCGSPWCMHCVQQLGTLAV